MEKMGKNGGRRGWNSTRRTGEDSVVSNGQETSPETETSHKPTSRCNSVESATMSKARTGASRVTGITLPVKPGKPGPRCSKAGNPFPGLCFKTSVEYVS
ncbi:hypothetical protein KM043_005037 [Ampulex compressa]|nr:hypothetical protein KM043_005037 [Ampulex compressa]